MTVSSDVSAKAQPDLCIVRLLDAPRELVFAAFTDPIHLAQWWGPNGFTTPLCELDARVGGAIRIHMRGPDGSICPLNGTYDEIVAPERLVLHLTPGGAPFDTMQTLTFVERDGKTELTLEVVVSKITPEAAGLLEGMEQGWSESLDRLAVAVAARKGAAS
jgi:uncharacterized protein YndB with AHSA1/START domain